MELNGRDLGLYVLTEGWDKQFLKRHFKKSGGNLYDGGFLKDITDELSTNAGADPKNQQDRIALAEAAKEPNLTNRAERLEKVLDMERFLTFIALDVMLWDWDGYAQNRNNWRLYRDPDKGRMVFMPHGLDQMFWKPEGSILPPMKGLVAKAVLDVPQFRERYFQRMKELRVSVFNPEQMTNRVREISAKIQPILKATDGEADQRQASDNLCYAISRRAKSLDEQLAHPIRPLEFDAAGLARLSGWESKVDFGKPDLAKASDPGHPSLLVFGPPTAAASGRGGSRCGCTKATTVSKLASRPKPSPPIRATHAAALDCVGPATGRKIMLGSSDWHEVGHDFAIDDQLAEVQLACEFRAHRASVSTRIPALQQVAKNAEGQNSPPDDERPRMTAPTKSRTRGFDLFEESFPIFVLIGRTPTTQGGRAWSGHWNKRGFLARCVSCGNGFQPQGRIGASIGAIQSRFVRRKRSSDQLFVPFVSLL